MKCWCLRDILFVLTKSSVQVDAEVRVCQDLGSNTLKDPKKTTERTPFICVHSTMELGFCCKLLDYCSLQWNLKKTTLIHLLALLISAVSVEIFCMYSFSISYPLPRKPKKTWRVYYTERHDFWFCLTLLQLKQSRWRNFSVIFDSFCWWQPSSSSISRFLSL